MDGDKEILDGFVVESREHLNVVEDELLQLEKQEGLPDDESVNKIFRGVHTIKGGAGFLGLEKINSLSHVMETLLSMVRSHELSPDAKVINALLGGVDLLRAMLDNVEHQQEADISAVSRRLNNLISRRVSKEVRSDLKKEVSLTGIDGQESGFTINEFQLKQIKAESKWLYSVKYDLNELRKTKKKSPLSVIGELEVIGDIVDGRLEIPLEDFSQSFKDVPLVYDVLYVSRLGPEKLMPVLGLDEKRLKVIFRGEAEEPEIEDVEVEDKDAETVEIPRTILGKTETVRINVDLLERLMNLAGELVLVRNQQLNNLALFGPELKPITQRLDLVTTEMQELIMLTRMQPIGTILGKFPRYVRELSRKMGKQVDLSITGSEVELDRTILESLTDPLTHIIRNSCDHGIESPEERKKAGKPETGAISIQVSHEAGQINIRISDDGRGIDTQKIKKNALAKGICTEDELAHMDRKALFGVLMRPGFSTAEQISDISGRGVGLDVVKSNIEKLNGNLELISTTGKGATLNLKLPLTLAIIPCLIVRVGEERFAIPQVNLEELVSLYDEEALTGIECAEERELFRLRDRLLPLVRLSEVLANPVPFTLEVRSEITERRRKEREEIAAKIRQSDAGIWSVDEADRTLSFAALKVGRERFGLIIDKVLGTEEIVVKPMHSVLRPLKCYAGATVMGDGRVAMILDVEGVAGHAGILGDFELEAELKKEEAKKAAAEGEEDIQKLLLFKSGEVERFALAVQRIRRIEEIQTSAIEIVGEKEFVTISGVSTPIIRLHHLLSVSRNVEKENMYLLIPKNGKNFGILVSELVDILESTVHLNVESFKEDGLLGTAIVSGKMTLFPDLDWVTRQTK